MGAGAAGLTGEVPASLLGYRDMQIPETKTEGVAGPGVEVGGRVSFVLVDLHYNIHQFVCHAHSGATVWKLVLAAIIIHCLIYNYIYHNVFNIVESLFQ